MDELPDMESRAINAPLIKPANKAGKWVHPCSPGYNSEAAHHACRKRQRLCIHPSQSTFVALVKLLVCNLY